ncbi:tyrosine-type recombinase/integrase [Brucella sp. 09RB8471]|uniref:tyrosine-type recombinase/integrase n=1 Tax=Brucella sp. 09RB8471 TaxID=1149952 RepID=UPI0009FACC2B|nr:tyrosine-type recombinase/integrase [Brucella sp. 09RB8471]MRN77076.1 tyrosine-type recombinase/integrase [Brucella sp. 10RB9210]
MLDEMQRGDAVTILTNTRGKPWTSDGFKTSWGKAIKKAEITGVTFHDLRGTFITKARRNGATIEEIAAASGHSIKEVTRVLEAHYLAHDEETNDAVILKMERGKK